MTNRYSFIQRIVFAAFMCLLSLGSASAQWTKLDAPTPMTTYNCLHTQVYLDGVLYMFGGSPGQSQAIDGAWSLDTKVAGAQWKTLASMPKARQEAFATAVDGKIYIVGGTYISNNTRYFTPEVLEYDVVANTYSTKATMTTPAYGLTGVTIGSKIYAMCGAIANGTFTNITQVYDVTTDTWSASTAGTLAAIYPTATLIGNDIYLMTGIYKNGTANAASNTVLKGTVNGATITWKKMGNFPIPMYGMASGAANGTLFTACGADGTNKPLATSYKYNLATDKWIPSFSMPIATYLTGKLVGDGTALYFIHGFDSPETYKFVDGPPSAIINSTPKLLEYKLKTGTSSSKMITIANTGTLPLTITLTSPSTDNWLTSDAGEVTIAAGEKFDITMFANSTGMTQGVYPSTITITSDDKTTPMIQIPVTMTLMDVTAKRLPLLEVFTSSTCGPCKPGNEKLNAVITPIDRSNFTVLKFQQDFPPPGDPYATNETVNRRNFYKINSIPRMEVDGGWDQNASSFTNQVLNDATSQVCLLNWQANYTVTGNTVKVTATLDPLADYGEQNMRLYVAVLEKETVKNIKTNGETVFEDVVKKMMPNENGTPLNPMTKGVKVSKSFEYTFPGKYRLPVDGKAANRIKLDTEHSVEDMENLEVIVWAQNTVTKEVYNAGWAVLGPADVIEDLQSSTTLSLGQNFPNPASGSTTIAYTTPKAGHAVVEIYNILGAKVSTPVNNQVNEGVNSVTIATENLTTGVYTVVLRINGQSVSKTMSIVHTH